MNQSIQIALPEETIQLIDRFTPISESSEAILSHRSQLINEAVKSYIAQKQKEILRQQLKEGAIQRSERDLNLAEDYFHLEEEAWQNL
ncbi:hypothetical protein [Planktothricoides raciborskii]|uniref:CopG family transcriptional regulator n=1 Tax=Planktothricoides raciborskii GIHE-MW2 TaxID=2792601 RepID=A0AAU8JKS8_9CYAN